MNDSNQVFAHSSWKLTMSVLWLLQAINFIAYLLILFLPGGYESYTGLETEDPMMIAIFCAIPGVLIALTLAVSPRISRWPNLLFGAMFILIKVIACVAILLGAIAGPNGEFLGSLFVNELWAIFAGALLVWCAWHSPGRAVKKIGPAELGASAA